MPGTPSDVWRLKQLMLMCVNNSHTNFLEIDQDFTFANLIRFDIHLAKITSMFLSPQIVPYCSFGYAQCPCYFCKSFIYYIFGLTALLWPLITCFDSSFDRCGFTATAYKCKCKFKTFYLPIYRSIKELQLLNPFTLLE